MHLHTQLGNYRCDSIGDMAKKTCSLDWVHVFNYIQLLYFHLKGISSLFSSLFSKSSAVNLLYVGKGKRTVYLAIKP